MNAGPVIAERPARILVVDDEPDNRELLAVILKWEGFLVATAASGEEALTSLAQQLPDLVLLDIMMPDMSGYQVVSTMKANPLTEDVPVIMVSAVTDRNARMLALSAGAADFLAKPLARAELVARVRAFLSKTPANDFPQGG